MLSSPSNNIPSLGFTHHALEEDKHAQDAQQQGQSSNNNNNMYCFGGFPLKKMLSTGETPNMLSTGQTPENMLTSIPYNQSTTGSTSQTAEASHLAGPPVYAPVASSAPVTHALQQADTDIIPQLHNFNSSVNLCSKLDLKKIAMHAKNVEYNPRRFAAVVMRIREPRTTALIFSSGKMVCTGAKTEKDSKLSARKFARIIQKLGFITNFKDFKIQNIAASCDVKFRIHLEGLALTHSKFASYEPELCPGLVYRMVKPRVVLLIFISGKVVFTGAKVREEIYEAFDNIYPILKNFKKQ